ncbi:MAG: hypothetical protein IT285_05695 [Bdellovibrionales bacterium]|nr:hypothetical protein [Bdellovibrionales bacterium]
MSKAALQNKDTQPEYRCDHCDTEIADSEKVLFVEEEVGRVFCSEACIVQHFGPAIEKLEKRYFAHLKASDLSPEERENLAHLRWSTLREPGETWLAKTVEGDRRYTLVSEFRHDGQPIWCVCISLFLRGEPSFLYLAFVTRDARLADVFREGEPVESRRAMQGSVAQQDFQHPMGDAAMKKDMEVSVEAEDSAEATADPVLDCLAEPWTVDETIRAELAGRRKAGDIPRDSFGAYEGCISSTLEKPDQVWSLEITREGRRMFHFVKHFAAAAEENPEKKPFWYLLVARETGEPEQIEILDALPTTDAELVAAYRTGVKEVDSAEDPESPAAQAEGEEEEPGDEEPKLRIVH